MSVENNMNRLLKKLVQILINNSIQSQEQLCESYSSHFYS